MDFTGAAQMLPALVGGIFQKKDEQRAIKASKKAAKKDYQRLQKVRAQDRRWYLADREDEREYSAAQLAGDRAYAARQLASDRAYTEKMIAADRLYAEQLNGKTLKEARAYAEAQRGLAEGRFKADRKSMQKLADKQAERAALSRGIDFKKLRDDAIAAGFNPLTAMSMAHAYSTDIAYGTVGDVYGGGGELTAGVSAPTIGAASGGYPLSGGGPMSGGGVAPGGFTTSGMGYSGTQLPPLMSSAGFIAEAVARGVDHWFNSPPPQDEEAQEVMRQVQSSIIRQEAEARTPRSFGYDLTKIEPFRPAVSYGSGALSAGYDDLHKRSVDREELRDSPATQYVDIGGDAPIRALNPDVFQSELAQTVGDIYTAGRVALRYASGGYDPRRKLPVDPMEYPMIGAEFHGPVFGSFIGVP